MKRIIIITLCSSLFFVITACKSQEEKEREARIQASFEQLAERTRQENERREQIKNMKIDVTNFGYSHPWHTMQGTMKNTSNTTVNGYVTIKFYNTSDILVDDTIVSMPTGGLKPNETFQWDVKTLKEYHSYVISKESLR